MQNICMVLNNSLCENFRLLIKTPYPENYKPIFTMTEISMTPLIHFPYGFTKIIRGPFLKQKEMNRTMTMCFPPEAAGVKERQAQQYNYDCFIRTMAEMIQKYAPEILG